jgi:tetratricopeptide (TPR) repeat protein
VPSLPSSRDVPFPRAGLIALAAGGVVYAILVVSASMRAGPRGWGLHAAVFLAPPLRIALLAGLAGCAALLALPALRPVPEPAARAAEAPRRDRGKGRSPLWALALLPPYAALLWLLRARTQLLGDGSVWLATAKSGEHRAYSEPLFAALWQGFAALVRSTGSAPDARTMGLFPILCGIAAVPILAGIAKEIAPSVRGSVLALGLLLTLGVSQLYFGYIESYPAGAVFILLYLWLALRRARGADSPWVLALALALAAAAHLGALYLVPSYLILVCLEKRPVVPRLLLVALPFVTLVVLLLALHYRPSQWAAPLRAATSGIREGFEGATFHRPYGFLSYGHLADVLNAVLLAMPVPALLLLGWAAATRGRFHPFPPELRVLAAAAIPGFLLLASLMTPVAPAQDWDLGSIFLLPAAVLGVAAGARLWGDRPDARMTAGLVGFSVVSLLSFVLVNASEEASIQRFRALVNDPVRVSRYGRAYGNSVLELYHRDLGRYGDALPYARAAVAAEPTNPRNWTNVGYELMRLNRHDEAIPYLREGIRRGPERWEGNYNLGLSYIKLGRYADAVPPLKEAVRIRGDMPVLRHNLGLALYRSGRADSALVVWREILARWPGYAASLRITQETPTE